MNHKIRKPGSAKPKQKGDRKTPSTHPSQKKKMTEQNNTSQISGKSQRVSFGTGTPDVRQKSVSTNSSPSTNPANNKDDTKRHSLPTQTPKTTAIMIANIMKPPALTVIIPHLQPDNKE